MSISYDVGKTKKKAFVLPTITLYQDQGKTGKEYYVSGMIFDLRGKTIQVVPFYKEDQLFYHPILNGMISSLGIDPEWIEIKEEVFSESEEFL